MQDNTEFQIIIGCRDSELHDEVIGVDELKDMVEQFFRRNETGFSMYYAKGGFLHDDGRYVLEDSLCIDIIGAHDIDIIRLAKGLSMYMNQENVLVVKNGIKAEYH